MTNEWEDLTADEKADHLKTKLDDLESRLNTQGQMLVGLDKLREDIESLKRVIGQLGFVDLDTDGGEG